MVSLTSSTCDFAPGGIYMALLTGHSWILIFEMKQ